MTEKLILPAHRKGRILDIGCGMYPHFLINTEFCQKYGLDKIMSKNDQVQFQTQKITLISHDIEKQDMLPFESEYFDVVTMLAVFEHIEPKTLIEVLIEIHRILKPSGMFILTTPASWTDGLLKLMAKVRLVSPIEIEEHKDVYNCSRISSLLLGANFSEKSIRLGYFEMFMNISATAIK